ncbi:MAG: PrsW family intramembrane metalloprotease [bacterium]|nr:PrsW family intramembrane metalloprotease [bacterium]
MPYIVFLVAVVLPIALWFWFIRWQDRSEPEPGRLMRNCFYAAITAGIGAGVFELVLFKGLGLPDDLLTISAISTKATPLALTTLAVFLVGPIEELAKYIVLRANVYFSHDFNQVFDGIVYGITIALGFSFVENIFYFLELYTNQTATIFIVGTAFRGLFSTLAHVTFTGIVGYFVGKAKFSSGNKTAIIAQGIVYASLLHASFDFLVAGPVPYGGLFAAVLMLCCFILFVQLWNRPDVRMIWKFVPSTPPVPPAQN